MKRIMFVALVLLVYPLWSVLGQESRSIKLSIRGAEPTQNQKSKSEDTTPPLTNESIVKLVKAKLGEDTIISMVNTQPGKYSLGVDEIIALKKSGVSENIIAAMLNKSPIPSAEKPETAKPAEPTAHVDSSPTRSAPSLTDAEMSVPRDHGLYYQASNILVPIEGQVISFTRTGSLLSSAVTFGIKSAKANVQILGGTSTHKTVQKPVFYYRAAEGIESAGGSAGDLVLVRMSVKQRRRQFEVAANGAWRASRGISIRSQLRLVRKQVEADLYRLTPGEELEPGEYGLYLFRGYDLPGYVFDFSVE